MKSIKHYIWFIKQSQSFMRHENSIKILFISLVKGFKYVKSMNQWEKNKDKMQAYIKMDRTIYFD